MMNLLFRSRDDAIVGGVCGGLGQFLGIKPLFLRLFFIALLFGNPIGILLYMLLWIIIPVDSSTNRSKITDLDLSRKRMQNQANAFSGADSFLIILQESQSRFFILGGILLVFIGLLILASILEPTLDINWLEWHHFDRIWPVLLIFGGLILLFRRQRGDDNHV